MSADQHFFYPEILLAEDLKVLQATVRALTIGNEGLHREHNPEQVAKIVLRLYCFGLTDPNKLTELAGLMADREAGFRYPA
ncbi:MULTISPECIES: hypothetical protein [Pseudorhizobium]|uniref:hypothetical protein n=1 Tax=Pseudorhizobium TaxID=1903858 RepID=UPI0004973CCC|nr:hypothetical protein [Pseudorhizobium marinum]|tara:strand:+ start:567 stop:809 length:243 start_codon:yes stop_codon:yes gene_type:complete